MDDIGDFVENWLNNNPYLKNEKDFLEMESRIFTSLDNKDFEGFLIHFGNIDKIDAFLLIKDMVSNRANKISLFRDVWCLSDIQHRRINELKELFLDFQVDIMNDEEKAVLNNLPNKITIYRGIRVPVQFDLGVSWSINQTIAEKFMLYTAGIYFERLMGRNLPPTPSLRTATIDKKDIICYLNLREEQEVIYWDKEVN